VGGVDQFTITNCSIGDTLLTEGNQQRYGIFIAAESSADFIVANNVIKNNVSLPIVNASTAIGNITNNAGYNPVGMVAVTTTASPMTYNAGSTPETLYISGGTVSNVSVSGVTLFSSTNCSVRLGCGQQVVITYSSSPTVSKYIE
jgi:hypothetical protein